MGVSRESFHVMIYYDYKRNLSFKKSHDILIILFGQSAPSVIADFIDIVNLIEI